MADRAWQKLHGKWNVTGSENFEEFLAEVGVPYLIRKMAVKSNSWVTLKVDDDKVKIQVASTFHTQNENEFHINGPETIADFGKNKFTAKAEWQEDKLIIDLKPLEAGKGKPQKITREMIGDEMHQTMEIGKITAKQRHTKAA